MRQPFAEGRERGLPIVEELLPVTVPEVRRLLWGLVWNEPPEAGRVLAWSHWRRRHQARARRRHWCRRLARAQSKVRL